MISSMENGDFKSKCESSLINPSTSAVTDHLGAVAAVIEVGAVLEHARVAMRFAATAAAAERM